MPKTVASPVVVEVSPALPSEELDLGPIRIINCKHIKDGKSGRYVLSVSAAGSIIQISASAGGNSVKIIRDGVELGKLEGLEEAEE